MTKKCFVVSPIGNAGSKTRRHADNVNDHLIKQACSRNEIKAIRVDELTTSTSITSDIFQHLDSCDLVIADITELNANVFLEIGYRIKSGRPIILIKDSDVEHPIPFDIQNIRIMEYSLLPSSVESSIETLNQFIQSVDYSKMNEHIIFPATDNSNGFKLVHSDAGVAFVPFEK